MRFAKNKVIFCEAYVTVMIRLHLAHGKKITILFEYECLNIEGPNISENNTKCFISIFFQNVITASIPK